MSSMNSPIPVDQTKCVESPSGRHKRVNNWWCDHCGAELGPKHDPVLMPVEPQAVCRTFCDQCSTPLDCCDTDFVHCHLSPEQAAGERASLAQQRARFASRRGAA